MKEIKIQWEGPKKLEEVASLNDEKEDSGLYQIYGNHIIFGPHSLLYIGQTEKQTFRERFSRHKNWLSKELNVEIYIGRIIDYGDEKLWSNYIDNAERLLIYYHSPPYNTQYINKSGVDEDEDFHVMNLGNYGRLVPEITTSYLKKYLCFRPE